MSFRTMFVAPTRPGVRPATWLLLGLIAAVPPLAAQEPDDLASESTSPDEVVERSDLGNVAQTAQMLYHEGVRDLERAESLEAKAASADDEGKRKKLAKQTRAARESAVEQFRQAISYDADLAKAYSGLAEAHRQLGEPEKALEVDAAAVRKWPEDLEVFQGWAESLLALDLLANATQAYTTYRESAPERAEILMAEMKKWLAAKRADPGDLQPADVERLADWIAMQEGERTGESG